MQREDIRRITLDVYKGDIIIPIAEVQEANALDFDLSEERIYWSDTGQYKDIKSAHVNGTGLKTVIRHGLEMPVSISVDWIAKNIYWSDASAHRIEVSRLNGNHRMVLLWENIESPQALAVNPHNGFVKHSSLHILLSPFSIVNYSPATLIFHLFSFHLLTSSRCSLAFFKSRLFLQFRHFQHCISQLWFFASLMLLFATNITFTFIYPFIKPCDFSRQPWFDLPLIRSLVPFSSTLRSRRTFRST